MLCTCTIFTYLIRPENVWQTSYSELENQPDSSRIFFWLRACSINFYREDTKIILVTNLGAPCSLYHQHAMFPERVSKGTASKTLPFVTASCGRHRWDGCRWTGVSSGNCPNWECPFYMENHRKTIGKWWFFMGFYGIYPLVIWFTLLNYGLRWFYRDDHGKNTGILMGYTLW